MRVIRLLLGHPLFLFSRAIKGIKVHELNISNLVSKKLIQKYYICENVIPLYPPR